jgi:hypothetical protein
MLEENSVATLARAGAKPLNEMSAERSRARSCFTQNSVKVFLASFRAAVVFKEEVFAKELNGDQYGFIQQDGAMGRRHRSVLCAFVQTRHGVRQKTAEEHLRALNLGRVIPLFAISMRGFVEMYLVHGFLPTLKPRNVIFQ